MADLGKMKEMEPLKNLLGEDIKDVSREELTLGQDLIVEVSTILVLKQGEQTGTLVIVHDVTREKMVEKLKTEFVSLSAHQLRTPLSAIKWTLKMFLEGDIGEITEEQKGYLEKTYQSNERMIDLINDLLNVTRIEEGRYLYKPELTDPTAIVQDVVDALREQIKNRKIKFRFDRPKKALPLIKADEEKIKLVVHNLLDNALAYTPSSKEISVFLHEEKDDIEFGVKDSGIGIPKDQQGRIFTKFFRGTNAMKVDTGGTGLGLYISKNIVEAHGGSIWFESKEGEGTTFFFKVPKAKP
jgi:signal transduction histidine kinase